MNNQSFAEKLRYYRKINRLSVQEVADYLSKKVKPISAKSIYSWENNKSKPSSDMFMTLCELYHIDHVLESFGYSSENTDFEIQKMQKDYLEVYEKLSEEELKLILAYRAHPEYKEAVKSIYQIHE